MLLPDIQIFVPRPNALAAFRVQRSLSQDTLFYVVSILEDASPSASGGLGVSPSVVGEGGGGFRLERGFERLWRFVFGGRGWKRFRRFTSKGWSFLDAWKLVVVAVFRGYMRFDAVLGMIN